MLRSFCETRCIRKASKKTCVGDHGLQGWIVPKGRFELECKVVWVEASTTGKANNDIAELPDMTDLPLVEYLSYPPTS
jgi:hypothetical protein